MIALYTFCVSALVKLYPAGQLIQISFVQLGKSYKELK